MKGSQRLRCCRSASRMTSDVSHSIYPQREGMFRQTTPGNWMGGGSITEKDADAGDQRAKLCTIKLAAVVFRPCRAYASIPAVGLFLKRAAIASVRVQPTNLCRRRQGHGHPDDRQ